MLNVNQRQLLSREIIISVTLNGVMTGLISWALFAHAGVVPYIAAAGPDLKGDLFITSFMVGLMSTVPTTLSIRRSARLGRVDRLTSETARFLPRQFWLRVLLVAAISTVVAGSLGNLGVMLLRPDGMAFGSFLVFKVAFAVVVSGIITPVIARRALRDPVPA
jgi:hypothetical protein